MSAAKRQSGSQRSHHKNIHPSDVEENKRDFGDPSTTSKTHHQTMESECSSPRSQRRFIVPLRVRNRLFTEETVVIRNQGRTCEYRTDASNPFLSVTGSAMLEEGDEESVVSSISDDSLRRFSLDLESDSSPQPAPPPEIFVPLITLDTPDWLRDVKESPDDTVSQPSPRRVTSSSSIPKPTMIKHKTAPAASSARIDIPRLNRSVFLVPPSLTVVTSSSKHSPFPDLLGSRPRLATQRPTQSVVSVGSFVGHSSWMTSPSTTVTSASSISGQIGMMRANQRMSKLMTAKPSMLEKDWMFLWSKLTGPVKQLLVKKETVDLKRSKGCLT